MSTFVPCRGKTACRDDGTTCLTCGRSLAEVVELRYHVDALVELARAYDYENVDEYAAYIAKRVAKKLTPKAEAV